MTPEQLRKLVAIGRAAGCCAGAWGVRKVSPRAAAAVCRTGGLVAPGGWQRGGRWRRPTVVYGRPLPALALWGGVLLHPRDPAHAALLAIRDAGLDPELVLLAALSDTLPPAGAATVTSSPALKGSPF